MFAFRSTTKSPTAGSKGWHLFPTTGMKTSSTPSFDDTSVDLSLYTTQSRATVGYGMTSGRRHTFSRVSQNGRRRSRGLEDTDDATEYTTERFLKERQDTTPRRPNLTHGARSMLGFDDSDEMSVEAHPEWKATEKMSRLPMISKKVSCNSEKRDERDMSSSPKFRTRPSERDHASQKPDLTKDEEEESHYSYHGPVDLDEFMDDNHSTTGDVLEPFLPMAYWKNRSESVQKMNQVEMEHLSNSIVDEDASLDATLSPFVWEDQETAKMETGIGNVRKGRHEAIFRPASMPTMSNKMSVKISPKNAPRSLECILQENPRRRDWTPRRENWQGKSAPLETSGTRSLSSDSKGTNHHVQKEKSKGRKLLTRRNSKRTKSKFSMSSLWKGCCTTQTVEQDLSCVECGQAQRTHIAVPCMHFLVCDDCARNVCDNQCPLCKRSVTFSRVRMQ